MTALSVEPLDWLCIKMPYLCISLDEVKSMRTTLNIEDNLIDQASKMTGIKEKTTLVKLGLEALIARESAKRLARLGGSEKQLKQIPRRRGI
jgi:Arc/MetJ family transcription regulator